MVTVYLNAKTAEGRETLDEISPEPGQGNRAFRAYVAEQIREHARTNLAVYQSSHPCANWKE